MVKFTLSKTQLSTYPKEARYKLKSNNKIHKEHEQEPLYACFFITSPRKKNSGSGNQNELKGDK